MRQRYRSRSGRAIGYLLVGLVGGILGGVVSTWMVGRQGVPLLGQIPLQAGMAELADRGEPIVVSQPESPAGIALRELARTVAARTAGLAPALPITAAPR